MKKPKRIKSWSITETTVTPGSDLSRRQFLQVAEIAIVGAAASKIPVISSSFGAPADDVEEALGIAENSPMFQEAIAYLFSLGIEFKVTPDAVKLSSIKEPLIGLVLRHDQSTSKRMGADVILTVDLQNKVLNTVQAATGWSLLDSLQVASVLFDIRLPLYPEWRDDRLHYDTPPRMLRPGIEQQWSFWRPDSPPERPEDLVLYGWPAETRDSHYWYFDGCNLAGWVDDQGFLIYRCEQVEEHQSDDLGRRRVLSLDYVDSFTE